MYEVCVRWSLYETTHWIELPMIRHGGDNNDAVACCCIEVIEVFILPLFQGNALYFLSVVVEEYPNV